MIELAQVHKKEGVEITALSEKHNLHDSAFDGNLLLHVEPDKISIWDIIESIDKEKLNDKWVMELLKNKHPLKTSTAIMVDKEIEVVLNMIQHRLQRHKLSAWSEKASRTIYI